jgi:hypothetical protein
MDDAALLSHVMRVHARIGLRDAAAKANPSQARTFPSELRLLDEVIEELMARV